MDIEGWRAKHTPYNLNPDFHIFGSMRRSFEELRFLLDAEGE
jgi:hypothetical protein